MASQPSVLWKARKAPPALIPLTLHAEEPVAPARAVREPVQLEAQ
jgi:hypothetical protein